MSRREVWGHSEAEDDGNWFGAFDSRDEAVADGRGTYGGAFYVIRGAMVTHEQIEIDAEEIAQIIHERMEERARELVGEAADGFPVIPDDAGADLERVLRRWARRWIRIGFWSADGEAERVDPTDPPAPEPPAPTR